MWNRDKARRRYEQSPEKRDATKVELTVLGDVTQAGTPGSHEFLAEVLEQVDASNARNSKSSSQAYCGLSSAHEFGMIEEGKQRNVGLIHIGECLVPGVLAAAKCFQAADAFKPYLRKQFPRLGVAGSSDQVAAQEALEELRRASARFIRMEMGVSDAKANSKASTKVKSIVSIKCLPDYKGYFNEFDNDDSLNLTRGAVTWTICHELAHKLFVDGASAPDRAARRELFSRVRKILPREVDVAERQPHLDEYACDVRGFEMVRAGNFTPERKYNIWPASILLCAVIALHEGAYDAALVDDANEEDTHPDPFDRVSLARLAFIESLEESQGLDMAILNDMTNVFIFSRFLAGEYATDDRGVAEFALGDNLKLLIDLFKRWDLTKDAPLG